MSITTEIPVPSLLLDLDEVARLLSVNRRTIERLVAAGTLHSVTINRSRRVHRRTLDAYVDGLMGGAA